MKEHVDPIISELLTDIVVDRPENVLKYMLEWTRKKRENDPEMIKLQRTGGERLQAKQRPTSHPPAKKGGSSYSGQPRNLSYGWVRVGRGDTLSGSGKEQDENGDGGADENKTPGRCSVKVERREAMLRAAEKTKQCELFRPEHIGREKERDGVAKETRRTNRQDQGFVPSQWQGRTVRAGMAKMETLQMHYRRAQGYSARTRSSKTRRRWQ